MDLYEKVKSTFLRSEGRGKKPKYSGLDRFIITLSHLKHAQHFNKFGFDFDLDASSANQLFHRTTQSSLVLREHTFKRFSMQQLRSKRKTFEPKETLLVVDVHFHKQTGQPAGTLNKSTTSLANIGSMV